MNLLFLNVGRRCELVDAFRRALAARGGGVIHGSDVTDQAPALYRVDRAHRLPHGSDPAFVDALGALCTDAEIDLVIPTIDPDLEYLSRHRAELERRCPRARLLLSSAEVVERCRDKGLSRARFAELGATVPEAVDPDDPHLTFPVFMKPSRGSASEGIRVLRTPEELRVHRADAKAPLFERVVEGPEYTVDVLCDFTGRALFAVPRLRLQVRSGEVTKGIVERHAGLEALAKRLAEGFGCHGPVTLQFRATGGAGAADDVARFVAMELNARMGGGLPLSIAAGADWPGWILDLAAGRQPVLDGPVQDGLLLLRYDASIFVPRPESRTTPAVRFDGIKAVIFDLDDTLYPERDYVYAGYAAVARRVYADHGVDIEGTLRVQFESGLREDVFGRALRAAGVAADEAYLQQLVELYRMSPDALRPFATIDVLSRLRAAGYRIGLLTDGFAAVQKLKVARLGIADLFDATVYSDDLGGRSAWKPSPLPYRRCLELLGVTAEQAMYVADNPAKDFRGPRELGIRTLRVRHPGGEHGGAAPATPRDAPDGEITSLAELPDLLGVGRGKAHR